MEKKHGDAEIAEGTKASGRGFEWEYLAGSNLKSQLTYPNDAVVTWTYEPHRDLLTAVTNATTSTYTYTYDLLGRRLSQNDLTVKYNHRDEIISIDNVFDIKYDDAGNRKVAGDVEYVTVDICGPGGNKIASLNFNPDGTLGSGREGSSINDITKGAKNFIEQTFGPKARKAFQGLKNYCPPCPANNSIPRVPQGPNGKNGNMPSPVTVRNSDGFPSGNGRGGIRGGGAGGGGAGCFKAGTLILTPNGLHTIDELNIGDVVLTYNFHKKEVQQNRIVDKVEILTEDIITIKTQTSCIIECSYKHLFYTTRGVKRAEQLMVGDLLLSKDSKGLLVPTRIVEIDDVSTTLQKVYNIGVEKNHNFFVGQDAILTHNQKPLALID